MSYRYVDRVRTQLADHGLRPLPTTPPALVRDQLNDLYRLEIRTLRSRLRAGEFPRREYAGRVVALRKRYWLLSVPVEEWTSEWTSEGTSEST